MTRRQLLADLLRAGGRSVEDLARAVAAPVPAVLADLEHIRRGLRPPDRWIVHEAACRSCGYVFHGRERLNTPSRCPRCRSEDIEDPVFAIGAR